MLASPLAEMLVKLMTTPKVFTRKNQTDDISFLTQQKFHPMSLSKLTMHCSVLTISFLGRHGLCSRRKKMTRQRCNPFTAKKPYGSCQPQEGMKPNEERQMEETLLLKKLFHRQSQESYTQIKLLLLPSSLRATCL